MCSFFFIDNTEKKDPTNPPEENLSQIKKKPNFGGIKRFNSS